ncbi:phage Gp19/Gp15/Gp42 family protein [Moryella indoligenes]|nr:phage Gp19/Gp15/Gp42 family protein [Moryella indoligenes]
MPDGSVQPGLLQIISDALRYEAQKVGKDLDAMVQKNTFLGNVARSVTVDIAMRELMTSTDHEPMTQLTESALGYSMSGTFLSPGGGLFIKRDELKRLGLMRQRYGVLEQWSSEGEIWH